MTNMNHAVTRETVNAYNVLYACHRRKVIVTLRNMAGDDMIEFRELRNRTKFYLPVEAAFKQAVYRKAMSEPRKRKTVSRRK